MKVIDKIFSIWRLKQLPMKVKVIRLKASKQFLAQRPQGLSGISIKNEIVKFNPLEVKVKDRCN